MRSLLYSALETLANRYLSLDKDAAKKLKPLSGKILGLEIKHTPLKLTFLFSKERIEVIAPDKINPDAKISGSLMTFMALSRQSKTSLKYAAELTISGDQIFAENAYHVLHDLDIDWEECIAHYTGDSIAHSLGRVCQSTRQWWGRGLKSFKMSLSDYLQEELRYFPAAPEVNDFMDEVDKITQALDRLQARLDLMLENKDD